MLKYFRQKANIAAHKSCIITFLMSKYNLSEEIAKWFITESYYYDSLNINVEETLHRDPEEWADDIYEYCWLNDKIDTQ